MAETTKFIVRALESRSQERSTCGFRQRLITSDDTDAVSVTYLTVHDAGKHHHTRTTEVYYILDGSGSLELDEETVEVEAGMAVMIPPGTSHKAVGDIKALIICAPAYTEEDMFRD